MNINEPINTKGFSLPFAKSSTSQPQDEALRLPFAKRIPDNIRNHFIAMSGEFVGTVLFLFFALSGTQVANNIPSTTTAGGGTASAAAAGANPAQLQYIALCFGFSLAVNAWVFFRISGGLFNPAVTLGMCLVGALPWIRGALLVVVQILGGVVASAIVLAMFPGPLTVRTSLGGGTSITQGLFIEMFLTAELVFTIFMLAAEKHKGTFIAPVGIGLSLFIAELTGVYFTGGSLNPARSFGPSAVTRTFHGYHWIYWVGPILGALLASGFYKFIKILEYETANPGQEDEKHLTEYSNQDMTQQTTSPQSPEGKNSSLPSQYQTSPPQTASSSALNPPPPPMVQQSQVVPPVASSSPVKPRMASPGMGSREDAFHGLASGGMHATETSSTPNRGVIASV